MDKIHNIQKIGFDKDWFLITVDNQNIKVEISKISKKLFVASEKDRLDYHISPSGYGIRWPAIDEDLSIMGILKVILKPNLA